MNTEIDHYKVYMLNYVSKRLHFWFLKQCKQRDFRIFIIVLNQIKQSEK